MAKTHKTVDPRCYESVSGSYELVLGSSACSFLCNAVIGQSYILLPIGQSIQLITEIMGKKDFTIVFVFIGQTQTPRAKFRRNYRHSTLIAIDQGNKLDK